MSFIYRIRIPQMVMDIQWAFISIAVSSFIHFVLRIFIGQNLGVDGLGLYTLVFTVYLFSMQFANFGIGSAITKFVAEDSGDVVKNSTIISKGLISSILIGTIMGLILFLLSSFISVQIFHNSSLDMLLKITAFCIPFIALQKAVLGALNGLRRMKYFAYINIFSNLLIIIFTIVLVNLFNFGITGAVLGFVVPTIIISLLSYFTISKFIVYPKELFDSTFKILTSFGFYVMLGNSISMLNTQINTLLIGYYLNTTEVGYFAITVTIIQGMILIPSSIQTISGPTISRLNNKNDYGAIKSFVKNCIIYTLFILFVILLFLVIFGNQLIGLLFTADSGPAYVPLIILAVGYLCYSPFISIGTFYANIGKVKLSFKINLLCTIITIILNIVLIPYFGIIGAAIATSISLIISAVINLSIVSIILKNL